MVVLTVLQVALASELFPLLPPDYLEEATSYPAAAPQVVDVDGERICQELPQRALGSSLSVSLSRAEFYQKRGQTETLQLPSFSASWLHSLLCYGDYPFFFSFEDPHWPPVDPRIPWECKRSLRPATTAEDCGGDQRLALRAKVRKVSLEKRAD